MVDSRDKFLTAWADSIQDNTFVKLTLGSQRGSDAGPRKIHIKMVDLARGPHLSFVYRHATKDVTKNVPVEHGVALVSSLLGTDFGSAHLFTTTADLQLTFGKTGEPRLHTNKPTQAVVPSRQHNRTKRRPIDSQAASYLAALGVTSKDGSIKKGMESKFRQINKFIEIIEPLLAAAQLKNAHTLRVLDMGSGKGYLTFALYDFLTNTLQKPTDMTGVEQRQELVDMCNEVARSAGFTGLHFECGSIQDQEVRPLDILIALHACNTATDEALYQAIAGQAALILCAPCCHKELRPQMTCAVSGLDRLLEFGILCERQAELVTDGMRALLLEAHGYKTSVFEFIATEHTSKNTMIAGVKTKKPGDRQAALLRLESLKQAFGIKTQHLDNLLRAQGSTIPPGP